MNKRSNKTLIERILDKVKFDYHTGCWIWTGGKTREGYGQIKATRSRKSLRVHRVTYEEFIEKIPEGLNLDHFVCDNPSCVNPTHVRPATQRENVYRSKGICAKNLSKTHCPNGHKYDWIDPQNNGRRCKKCFREKQRDYMRRKRNGQKQNSDRTSS